VRDVIPHVENQEWFFDTELLVLAEKHGYHIAEVPVHWTEDPDSRVHILKTIAEDIRGVLRLRYHFYRESLIGSLNVMTPGSSMKRWLENIFVTH
jgi:hypothetical protein